MLLFVVELHSCIIVISVRKISVFAVLIANLTLICGRTNDPHIAVFYCIPRKYDHSARNLHTTINLLCCFYLEVELFSRLSYP